MIDVTSWRLRMAEPKSPPGNASQQDQTVHADNAAESRASSPAFNGLGRREREVMSVLWESGAASVQQVAMRMGSGLAYTTVMTTLDRLFRKGLLRREKRNRAFIYSAVLSAKDVEGRRAADMIRRFFGESNMQPEVLISCLIDAVHHYDTELLDHLDSRIRSARALIERNGPDPQKGGSA
jgi:predicted transcriptional regulator